MPLLLSGEVEDGQDRLGMISCTLYFQSYDPEDLDVGGSSTFSDRVLRLGSQCFGLGLLMLILPAVVSTRFMRSDGRYQQS